MSTRVLLPPGHGVKLMLLLPLWSAQLFLLHSPMMGVVSGIPSCPLGQNTCANRRCFTATVQCDGKDDCGDNSDEWECEEILAKINPEDHVVWPWWILIVCCGFVIITCVAVVCRYISERGDPSLNAYLSPATTITTTEPTLRSQPLKDMSRAKDRKRPRTRPELAREQPPSYSQLTPLRPPPRLTQSSAQGTRLTQAEVVQDHQPLSHSEPSLDVLPPAPQPSRVAPPVPQTPKAQPPQVASSASSSSNSSNSSSNSSNSPPAPHVVADGYRTLQIDQQSAAARDTTASQQQQHPLN